MSRQKRQTLPGGTADGGACGAVSGRRPTPAAAPGRADHGTDLR